MFFVFGVFDGFVVVVCFFAFDVFDDWVVVVCCLILMVLLLLFGFCL